ncbi:uncharacterized protein PgNI_02584 [Pyricularia grisea]|uniref:Uncharacterized protein n=1 Tax=Pyricularia grisea TaxID=148305 RepID=A0A6P8BKC4_PYRGI|nr:uncharacterized protein PgNI_02584 [Pyricularia grisea]TLD17351.1 hypothetical protein PgNI_02584 [Pyricularia grisea]
MTEPLLSTMARLAIFCMSCINLQPVNVDITGASAARKVARRCILSWNKCIAEM